MIRICMKTTFLTGTCWKPENRQNPQWKSQCTTFKTNSCRFAIEFKLKTRSPRAFSSCSITTNLWSMPKTLMRINNKPKGMSSLTSSSSKKKLIWIKMASLTSTGWSNHLRWDSSTLGSKITLFSWRSLSKTRCLTMRSSTKGTGAFSRMGQLLN